MSLISIVVVACMLLARAKITNVEETKEYLKHYVQDDSLTDLKSAIMAFQQRYNLFIDGELNNETLELLNRPRCVEG